MPGRGQSMPDASGATVEERGTRPLRATGTEATPVGRTAAAAPSSAHDRGGLAHRRGRRHRRHRAGLPQRCLGRSDHRHRRRRHCRAVDERHRSAGHPRHRPGRELCGVVVGHRVHGLAAGRGADRLPAMASPGDLPGGVTGRAARARSPVRPDHPAPSLRRPAARELGRLVAALDPDAVARWAVGHCSVHAGARGAAAQSTEVGGRGRRHARRAGPPPSRRRLGERGCDRRPHRRRLRLDRLPLLRAERGLPGDVPPGTGRASRRRWRAR